MCSADSAGNVSPVRTPYAVKAARDDDKPEDLKRHVNTSGPSATFNTGAATLWRRPDADITYMR